MTRTVAGVTLAALLAAAAAGQDRGPKPPDKEPGPANPFADLPRLDATANYLPRVARLRALLAAPGRADLEFLPQMLAAEAAFVGRHAEAMRLMDVGAAARPPAKDAAALDPYEPKDAVEAVLGHADRYQVVMINEAHHVARHRAFATLLLEGLKKKGFTYFAAETFESLPALVASDLSALPKRGYPTVRTGYYSNEPVFGDLVRTAVRLGFTPVAYEHRPAAEPGPPKDQQGAMRQVAEREEGQARNLKAGTFDRDPKARVVVFAGYSHISKAPIAYTVEGKRVEQKWMAARFKDLTGIDPLCVDQTEVMERSKPEFEHPAYRLALEKGKVPGDRPVVLFDRKAGKYYVPPAARDRLDVTVFHPRDKYEDGRPTWLRMGGYRKPARVARLPGPPKGASLLVQAFRKGEDMAVAVPVDQLEYGPADPAPVLLLPTGEYAVRVVNAAGKVVHTASAAVE